MSNLAPLKEYERRLTALEQEKRDAAEAIRDLKKEMKNAGFEPAEIKGVALAVKRSFEDDDKRAARESAEAIAAALGEFAETALGKAAVSAGA